MLSIVWPTLAAGTVAGGCLLIWATNPRRQRSEPLRVALIVSTPATVALGLIAGVEIVARVLGFGLDEAY